MFKAYKSVFWDYQRHWSDYSADRRCLGMNKFRFEELPEGHRRPAKNAGVDSRQGNDIAPRTVRTHDLFPGTGNSNEGRLN
jgi:hypothetical protein